MILTINNSSDFSLTLNNKNMTDQPGVDNETTFPKDASKYSFQY